jgi:hypothetical protein
MIGIAEVRLISLYADAFAREKRLFVSYFNKVYYGGRRVPAAHDFAYLCDFSTAWRRAYRPAYRELKRILQELSASERLDVEALMWLGRDGGKWADLRTHADSMQDDQNACIQYLLEKPLGKYLRSAIARWPK